MSTAATPAVNGAGSNEVGQEVGVGASAFSDTLLSLKEMFVKDLEDGNGKGWTVVMGNEAGGESDCVELEHVRENVSRVELSSTLKRSLL